MKLISTPIRIAAVATVGAGLGLLPLALAAAPAAAAPVNAGNLIYLSPTGAVELVSVNSSGATSSPHEIGPLSTVTGSQQLTVSDLVASADGAWAAWSEEVTTSSTQPPASDLLVVRNNKTGQEYSHSTVKFPVGFAGHTLVADSGVQAYKVVLTPTVHLVSLHDKNTVLGAYKHGLIDDRLTFPGKSHPKVLDYDHIRLHPFSGTPKVVHEYTMPQNTLRNIELTTPSGDSKHLLIERGDKTDFGGNGPSSVIDELALTGAHKLTKLGHYGTASAQWRAWTESYVGTKDAVWVTWYRVHSGGVTSVVTRYSSGHWQLVASHAVTAVGNSKGYVVIQPGKFTVVANTEANQHVPTPTADAVLFHLGHQHALNIEGSAYVWVSNNVVPTTD
jgi:hypothetical protein